MSVLLILIEEMGVRGVLGWGMVWAEKGLQYVKGKEGKECENARTLTVFSAGGCSSS
jgi:hypothetical protein